MKRANVLSINFYYVTNTYLEHGIIFGCTDQVVQELQVPEACLPNYVIFLSAKESHELKGDLVIEPVDAGHVEGVVDQLRTVRRVHIDVIIRIQFICQQFPGLIIVIHSIVT